MPIPLVKLRPHPTAPVRRERWTLDWLGIWAIILGTIAVGLASFVYIVDGNAVAASFVLLTVAAIIGIMLREGGQSGQAD
jgi:hypothetical protein